MNDTTTPENKIVMISGSRTITDIYYGKESLDRIMEKQLDVIVGDAPGVDDLVQQYLASKDYQKVKIYYAMLQGRGKARNAIAGWELVGVPGSYVDRDKMMCSICRWGLALWDGKSWGTKQNIERVKNTKVIKIKPN